MSEETTPATEDKTTSTEGNDFKPITTQADLDKLVSDRLKRERSKYEGFEEYKAKAAKFDELDEASKSELQKEQDARAKAEKELESYRQKEQIAVWASEVSKATGVPADVLRGSTKEDIEAHAEQLKDAYKTSTAPSGTDKGGQPPADQVSTGDWIRESYKR